MEKHSWENIREFPVSGNYTMTKLEKSAVDTLRKDIQSNYSKINLNVVDIRKLKYTLYIKDIQELGRFSLRKLPPGLILETIVGKGCFTLSLTLLHSEGLTLSSKLLDLNDLVSEYLSKLKLSK